MPPAPARIRVVTHSRRHPLPFVSARDGVGYLHIRRAAAPEREGGVRVPADEPHMTRNILPLTMTLIALCLLTPASAESIEPWADSRLPAKIGLAAWLDATRQPAAWEANGRALTGDELLDVFYDGSGHRRDFSQPFGPAQPKFVEGRQHAAIRFDGK